MYFHRLEDLRIDADKTQQEIADVLHIEVGTVKSRIFRARKRLCTFLIEDGNIPDLRASGRMKGGEKQ